ncbi:MAG: MMPL family transporter [Thermoplasmatales archaeon]|nr:MMPL family transporter [Thermoplasmatales archaeon]
MNIRPFAKLLANRPKTILLAFTIITIFIGWQATNIYMISEFTEYLPSDDPTLMLYNRIMEEFEVGQTIIILVDQTGYIHDIRDPEILTEIDNVERAINRYENDKGEIDGIVAIRSLASLIKNENAKSKIEGGNGVKEIPTSKEDVITYMERIAVKSTKGVLYTNSYNFTVVRIQLSDDSNFEDILTKTEKAVDTYGNRNSNMTITGSVAMQKAIQKQSMRNLVLIFPIALVLVSIVLFFFHRTIKGILIAFLPPAFAIALTFGVLGIVQPELTIISVAIVALLIGLGVDYSIHLMNRYLEENDIEDKVERVEKILRFTGKAVLLSTITTMIGFSSLMISSMMPMITFGFGCAIGILFCFISAMIIVPCLVIILNFEKKDHVPSWKKLAKFTINNRNRIILIASFFAVISLAVLPQVGTDVDYLDMAPDGIPEVEAMYKYSDKFGSGSNFNALLVEMDQNGLLDPDVIEAIYDMEEEMRNAIFEIFEGKIDEKILEKSVYSIVDEIKSITDIINRSIIIDRLGEILGAEKIIFDMIAENGVIDYGFSKTIIIVSIPIDSTIAEKETVVNKINSIASSTYLSYNGTVSELTGQDAIIVSVNNKLTDEQIRSMILALILVLAALILIFGSSAYGALTMIPVVFVLMWEPGFLVALDISLSLVTISIAAIMIGIGIDYGVHITHRFREEMSNGCSKVEAIKTSIERTGSSLVEAALTTIAGIAAIYFVNTPALNEFVTVIILMTALSCIAAALILPVFYGSKFVK